MKKTIIHERSAREKIEFLVISALDQNNPEHWDTIPGHQTGTSHLDTRKNQENNTPRAKRRKKHPSLTSSAPDQDTGTPFLDTTPPAETWIWQSATTRLGH